MLDEENKKVTQYLIPANVTTKFEFFEGFGWYEFKIVFLACAIGTLFFLTLGLPKRTIQVANYTSIDDMSNDINIKQDKKVPIVPMFIRVLFIAIPSIGAFFIVKRNPSSGMSLITIVRSRNEFIKRQKRYLYRYKSGMEVK